MQIFYHHPAPRKKKQVPTMMAVKQHRPWLCPTLLFITIITIIVGGLYLWNTSVKLLRQDKQEFIERYLREHPTPLNSSETRELQSKLASVTSNAESLAKFTNKLQEQQLDLVEELNFYKDLVTSNQTSAKIKIGSFTLYKNAENYIYKLVLTQNNTKTATGTVQINIVGELKGKIKQLDMAAITKDSIAAINYKIDYFQRFVGHIKLPKAFIPKHLTIRLATENNKTIENIKFKWEELQSKE
ncbi:hypothetical protein QUF50_00560 [Thiotrichales bacterium HSG1]|nr:hypothetical protein [Thiotrichales bacterium HSG1]